MRVLIPFGARKIYEVGYVVGLKETSEYECKNIIKVIDKVFDEEKLELAKWISQRYFCTLSDSLRLLVPPGTSTSFDKVKTKTEKVIYLSPHFEEDGIQNEKQRRVIEFLKDNHSMPKNLLKEFLGTSDSVLKTLEKNGQVLMKDEEVLRNPLWNKKFQKSIPFELTDEQKQAMESIDIEEYQEYLIHGVTRKWKNRNLFKVNRKGFKKWKKCHCACS